MGESRAGWRCPGCGANLPDESFAAGQRLARCRRCSKMVRRESAQNWPVSGTLRDNQLSGQPNGQPGLPLSSQQTSPNFQAAPYFEQEKLEIAPAYAYPALACPYCEHINTDSPSMRANGQQFCANCGADLKKACLNCDAPMYILDHFCTQCRSDQEKARYEIEGVYRQHFNEGKRLAQMDRWQDAERELSLFFNPAPDLDRDHVRLAHQIYISSIAPYDNGEGLRLYNEAVEQGRRLVAAQRRKEQRSKYIKWMAVVAAILLLGIFSAVTLGSWWAIFIIVPLASFILIVVGWLLLASLGVS